MVLISALNFWIGLLVIIIAVVTSHRIYSAKKRQKEEAFAEYELSKSNKVLIAFASQSGFAESIAWQTAKTLRSWGVEVELTALGVINAKVLTRFSRALFIVSTTGKGEAPDNAREFVKQHMQKPVLLSGLEFAVLALGDRSHENYCAFGRRLDSWLRTSGAHPFSALTEVDNADPGALKVWESNLNRFKQRSSDVALPSVQYYRWKLVDRTLLNKGSAGGPVYLVALCSLDIPPLWRAGDIVEVLPGPADATLENSHTKKHREYSVASLPADGRLELVIRQIQLPDGRSGMCSNWLTKKAAINERVMLRVRSNRSFHGPENDQPMILIGNGTGIAGLRAHLKSRSLNGAHENWLIFGERNSEHDWFFRNEIVRWQAEGHIKRLDLAFSRDQTDKIYVQHRLHSAATTLKQWVDNGAYIYICGSLEGMSTEVKTTVQSILGKKNFLRFVDEGRYRCDVY